VFGFGDDLLNRLIENIVSVSFHLIARTRLIAWPTCSLEQLVVLQWFALASLKFVLLLGSVQFKEILVRLLLVGV
jgi:hypothetical protein